MALCQYIVDELTDRIDGEKIADALKDISMEDLAVKIRQKYCQQGNASCTYSYQRKDSMHIIVILLCKQITIAEEVHVLLLQYHLIMPLSTTPSPNPNVRQFSPNVQLGS